MHCIGFPKMWDQAFSCGLSFPYSQVIHLVIALVLRLSSHHPEHILILGFIRFQVSQATLSVYNTGGSGFCWYSSSQDIMVIGLRSVNHGIRFEVVDFLCVPRHSFCGIYFGCWRCGLRPFDIQIELVCFKCKLIWTYGLRFICEHTSLSIF